MSTKNTVGNQLHKPLMNNPKSKILPLVPDPNNFNNEIPFAKIKVHQQLQSQPFMTLFLTKYLKYFIIYSIIALIVVSVYKFIYYYYLIDTGELPKEDEQSIYVKCIKDPKGCATSIIMKIKDIFMKPIIELFSKIFSILHGIVWDIQHINVFISRLRHELSLLVNDLYNKLLNTYKRIIKIFKVIVKTVDKLMDLLKNIFEVLNYAFHTLASMWNGPMGAVTRSLGWLFCFGKGTKLLLNNGEQVNIEDLKLGMILKDGGEVLSLMKFKGDDVEMYEYDGVLVSGEHPVLEDNEWMRIEDATKAKRAEYNGKYIYCLETRENYIKINNTIYGDYIEIPDKTVNNNIQDIVIDYMNNKTFKKYNKKSTTKSYNWCFYENTLIDMPDGKYMKIKDLNIGDKIKTGIVTGLVKTNSRDIEIYKHNNIILSGTALVKINEEWKQVCKLKDAIYLGNNEIIMYNIVTDTNLLSIRESIYCDFDQTSDPTVNNYIDDLVIHFLNNNNNNNNNKYLY
jgi:hypothetical protein